MNGGLRPVPDPSTTQMTRELTERAQDKQAAVAMRGQDLQVGVNATELAVRLLVAYAEVASPHDFVTEALKSAAKLAHEFFQPKTPVDPLSEIPSEVLVRA